MRKEIAQLLGHSYSAPKKLDETWKHERLGAQAFLRTDAWKASSVPAVGPWKDYTLLWFTFPAELSELEACVLNSRSLLELEDDWDGEGSPGYTEDHWKRVVRFLSDNANWLFFRLNERLKSPEILPGPNGSLDVHWKYSDVELLLSVPRDLSLPATFYGDNFNRDTIKGSIDFSRETSWLMLWLMGRK